MRQNKEVLPYPISDFRKWARSPGNSAYLCREAPDGSPLFVTRWELTDEEVKDIRYTKSILVFTSQGNVVPYAVESFPLEWQHVLTPAQIELLMYVASHQPLWGEYEEMFSADDRIAIAQAGLVTVDYQTRMYLTDTGKRYIRWRGGESPPLR